MAPIKFYADLRSQPCRAVYIFLKATGIPFELVKVDLFAGDQLQEEFTNIHPIQRVPVIDDNGFILGESGGIFRYLSRKFGVSDHWYPADLQQQARVDEYLQWHHTNTRMSAMMTFRHQFISAVRGKPVKVDEVNRFKAELAKTIKHLDVYFLKNSPFIGGRSDVSVADLQALCELMQLDAIGQESLYLSNAKVKAWADRVKARLRVYFDECHRDGIGLMEQAYKAMTSKM